VIENKENLNQHIVAKIPIVISYGALQQLLNEKLAGEIIKKEGARGKDTKFAEIVDLTIRKSQNLDFDIEISLQLKSLLLLYKHKRFSLKIDATISVEEKLQKILIKDYEIDSKGLNIIGDNILESFANKFLHGKMIEKMQLDLVPKLKEQLFDINEKLSNRIEAQKGTFVSGNLENLSIIDIQAKPNHLWILIGLNGWGVIEISEIIES